jgi:EAL and modified HD-GYP domain-containing signal transduction protein
LGADELETSDLLASCKQVKQLGYQISLVNYIFDPQTAECLSYVDLVKVNTQGQDQQQLTDTIQRLADFDVQLIAQNIHTPADFNTCKQLGFDFFQGYFFAKPEQGAKNELPTSKLTLVELIGASSTDTFDIEAINNIVEHDVGLTYILLRFINNPSINKRYKITSLRHALHYMGELELKKFIALLSLANLADEKSTELLHLSLVRAKFCDLVGTQRDKGSNPPTAFLVGLLSSLDALLDQNMLELVKQLPLVDEVKEALCGNENELFYYLVLVRAFESGNWLKVIRIAKMLELDQKTLHSFFNQAILWGNGLRKSISPHFPETKA